MRSHAEGRRRSKALRPPAKESADLLPRRIKSLVWRAEMSYKSRFCCSINGAVFYFGSFLRLLVIFPFFGASLGTVDGRCTRSLKKHESPAWIMGKHGPKRMRRGVPFNRQGNNSFI